MPLDKDSFERLEALILAADKKTEVDCMQLLAQSCDGLINGTVIDYSTLQEDRTYFGDSDLVISAMVRNDRGPNARKCFLWELKAPQCYLMERDDNNNRYRPTMDLIKAENQLIHYAYQAQNDNVFRERVKVIEQTNIYIGGIIIGRDERIVKGATTVGERERGWKSLDIRESYLHSKHGIRVLTWDRVLDLVRPN